MGKRGRPPKTNPIVSQLTALRQELESKASGSVASLGRIPDIMEFIESPDYLGLSHYEPTPITLFPFQKVALKTFYRGSVGNENLKLTDEEVKPLQKTWSRRSRFRAGRPVEKVRERRHFS